MKSFFSLYSSVQEKVVLVVMKTLCDDFSPGSHHDVIWCLLTCWNVSVSRPLFYSLIFQPDNIEYSWIYMYSVCKLLLILPNETTVFSPWDFNWEKMKDLKNNLPILSQNLEPLVSFIFILEKCVVEYLNKIENWISQRKNVNIWEFNCLLPGQQFFSNPQCHAVWNLSIFFPAEFCAVLYDFCDLFLSQSCMNTAMLPFIGLHFPSFSLKINWLFY